MVRLGPAEGASALFPNTDLNELGFRPDWQVVVGGCSDGLWVSSRPAQGPLGPEQGKEVMSNLSSVACEVLPLRAGGQAHFTCQETQVWRGTVWPAQGHSWPWQQRGWGTARSQHLST